MVHAQRPRRQHHRLNEKGVIIIASYVVISLLLAMQATYLSRLAHDLRATSRFREQTYAMHVSEGGLDDAMRRLKLNGSYTGTVGPVSLGMGAYDSAVEAYAGSATLKRIRVQGYAVDPAGSGAASSTHALHAIVSVTDNPFGLAVFSNGSISGGGSILLDMFNSENGLYEDTGETANESASIGTNDTSDGAVVITGNADLGGANIYSGAGSDPGSAILTGPNVESGEELVLDSEQILDPISIPDVPVGYSIDPLSLSGGGSMILDTDNPLVFQTAAGGYAVVVSSLSVTGNANLLVPADGAHIDLYVFGETSMVGNSTIGDATGQSATQLTLYSVGDVRLGGNAEYHGGIYAPSAGVDVFGNAELYGAIVGDEVALTGHASVHYDLALSDQPGSMGKIVVLIEWHDIGGNTFQGNPAGSI